MTLLEVLTIPLGLTLEQTSGETADQTQPTQVVWDLVKADSMTVTWLYGILITTALRL